MEQIPLFDDLQQPRDRIFRWGNRNFPEKCLTLAAGQTVFHEGSKPGGIFQIESGTLKLSKATEDGRQLVLGFPSTSELIGSVGVTECSHTAETVTATKLRPILRCPVNSKRVIDQDHTIQLLDWIEQQRLANEEHVSLLAISHISSRVAAFLLSHGRKQLSDSGNPAVLDLPMTQRDIATYLAIAPETYSRTLRKLREAGIVKPQNFGKARVTLAICNIVRLREIACGENI